MNLSKKFFLILLTFCSLVGLIAEEKEHAVTILEQNVEYYYDGNNLKKHTFHQKYRIENQAGVDGWCYTTGSWRPWYQEKPNITATVTNPDGEVYTLDPSTLVEVGTKERNNIYSDDKRLKAPLPSIKIGSVVEENVVTNMTKPYFGAGYDTGYTTQSNVPIEKLTLTVDVPSDIEIQFKEYGFEFNPVIEEENGRKKYKLQLEDLEALEPSPLFTGSDYRYWPELLWTTVKSWNSAVMEYGKFIAPQLKENDKVKDFLKPVNLEGSNEEVITNILMHLHKEVRYTGLELGEASILPHTPNEIIERKYGDCKDKAVLLQALLKEVGIESNVALLNAGYGADVAKDVPGIRQFNHAILYLPKPFDIWIDATSEFSRLGELPVVSANRYALIIDDNTTGLVKTTSQIQEDNIRTYTHNVYMSQIGEAKVVESLYATGTFGRDRRSFFHSLSDEKVDERIGDYVENSFNSETYENLKKIESRDLANDFYYEFTIPETNYGYTDSDSSIIYFNLVDVFDILPASFKEFQHYEEGKGELEDSKWFERDKDIYLNYPFINEHNYVVHFPEGFQIDELPENEEYKFGSTIYKRTFETKGNKVVIGSSLESGDGVYSPQEFKELRAHIYKIRNEKRQQISATSYKNLFINNDEFQSCVNYYLGKIESEPNEISHHIRLSAAYIEAGFAEAGNKHLEIALSLDPDNVEAKMSYAFSNLYDEVGRNEYKKENIAKAIEQYLEVIDIDPEINNAWRNLAVLSEYGDNGYRYSEGASLDVANGYYDKYKEHIQKSDLDYNILHNHLKMENYDWIIENIDSVKKINTFEAWSIYFTAVAVKSGAEAAYKQVASLTNSPDSRKKLLENTSSNIQQLRDYGMAAKLLTYIDKSTEKYIEVENKVKLLNSISHYEDEVVDETKPESVVQKFLFKSFSGEDVTNSDIEELFSKELLEEEGSKELIEEINKAKKDIIMSSYRDNANIDLVRDMLLTGINYNIEETAGIYRIITTMNMPSEQYSQHFFVWKENGKYKLIHNDVPWLLGDRILKLLGDGKKVEAVKILNWAKSAADSSEYSSLISSVWKSNKRSAEWIKMGVASLTYNKNANTEELLALKESFAKKGLSDIYTWMLATHYTENDCYEKAYQLVRGHIEGEGLSSDVVGDYAFIYHKNGKYEEINNLLLEAIEFEPGNVMYHNSVAYNYALQDKYLESYEHIKAYVDNNSDNAFMLNNLAWHGLFTDTNREELLNYSIKSNQITKFENWANLDTLAVILAENGKVKQSREILLHLMGNKEVEDLDGEYYIMGLNAETLGLIDEAKYYYSKVEEPEEELGVSTYILAQRRLEKLM